MGGIANRMQIPAKGLRGADARAGAMQAIRLRSRLHACGLVTAYYQCSERDIIMQAPPLVLLLGACVGW